MSIIQKERKHAFDQESDQGKKKKKRKHDLDQESDQEKNTFFLFFLSFFYKFSPLHSAFKGEGENMAHAHVVFDPLNPILNTQLWWQAWASP